MVYKVVDRYESAEDTTICRLGQSSKECDSLVYGCLIKGLRSLELLPKRLKASQVQLSVKEFADDLRSLKCFMYPGSGKHYNSNHGGYYETISHSNCAFTLAFENQIGGIIGQTDPSGVLEVHLTHIKEQKK